MTSILHYDGKADQEVYLAPERLTNLPGSLVVTIEAATIAGAQNKPNEDAFEVVESGDSIIVGLFDGTTSLKPITSLGDQTGARFASHFLKQQLIEAARLVKPEKIMLTLNTMLLEKSLSLEGATLSDTHTLPASMATIAKIEFRMKQIDFAHVGDSFGILYFQDGHSEVFTDDRNKIFDDKLFDLISQIARELQVSPREARSDPRVNQALVEMYNVRNNNPNGKGSGLVNGDPHVSKYIQTGKVSLKGVQAVLFASDGLPPQGCSHEDEGGRQKIYHDLLEGGFGKLFAVKHQSEDADPDWHFVRYKHSDDATGVLVRFPI